MTSTDPHPAGSARFIGKAVVFSRDGKRLVGVVESARFAGFTTRGNIPDTEMIIVGKSGTKVTASLVENHVDLK